MVKQTQHIDQLTQRREALCEIYMDTDRIVLTFDKVYPKAVKRTAEEMENLRLCTYAIAEGNEICLIHPDYGMFADDDEFRSIVSQLMNEENYEIIYMN